MSGGLSGGRFGVGAVDVENKKRMGASAAGPTLAPIWASASRSGP